MDEDIHTDIHQVRDALKRLTFLRQVFAAYKEVNCIAIRDLKRKLEMVVKMKSEHTELFLNLGIM